MDLSKEVFQIDTLGECKYDSPLRLSTIYGDNLVNYETDDKRVLLRNVIDRTRPPRDGHDLEDLSFEIAGPRAKTFFEPSKTTCAIVTCGGLCPGVNNVIRSLVLHLHHGYGVKKILGFRHGYQGLVPNFFHVPMKLDPETVKDINGMGGTILGTSRGPQDVTIMVDTLEKLGVDCLFTIGGDGTLRGANALYQEVKKRGLNISIIGIPKTIDNDLMFIDKTFGFETAFSEAARAIRSAHTEASAAPNGVGIVKLMGRHSGYVASYAALALREVNLVLIPEQKFTLEKVYEYTKERIKRRGHIVIVIAEGAGQDIIHEGEVTRDASGNIKLKDIGRFISDNIKVHFKKEKTPLDVKYIDPSYMIRSAPAYPTDSVFTGYLAHYAGDAAMSGKTGLAVGYWKGNYTHLTLSMATSQRNIISMESELWRSVLRSTGQPQTMI
ncbi:MAG: ATP-dependent 6-phosphofructokinase [Bacteriovoracia bacterium]